jgi:hypothetical protein
VPVATATVGNSPTHATAPAPWSSPSRHPGRPGAQCSASEFVRSYVKDFNETERVERERRTRGVTFKELAHAYLEWLEVVRGAKPSTIRSHQSDLAEPGTWHNRGTGATAGRRDGGPDEP